MIHSQITARLRNNLKDLHQTFLTSVVQHIQKILSGAKPTGTLSLFPPPILTPMQA